MKKCDFSGWATKNDLRCNDGLIIRHGAFKVNDGKRVPLVWNHQHNSPANVLGHAVLENRDEGVYAYCSFNDTEQGQNAKETVKHGDVCSLSIWANNIQRVGDDVLHGVIREVSLVLAGANPGAFIESVLAHGEAMGEEEEEAILYNSDELYISHADTDPGPEKQKEDQKVEDKNDGKGKTVGEVLNTLSEEQKKAVAIVIGQAIQDSKGEPDDDDEEEKEMKHNVFEAQYGVAGRDFISHDDMKQILKDAKQLGSLREAVKANIEDGVLSHAIPMEGMEGSTGNQTYGFNDPDMLFPDYKSLNNPPEWLSREMGWVKKIMAQVHHTPFSRIKSQYANITEDEARARGYMKGKLKKEEVFTLLKRTTDPQTVYKKQKLDRDDIIDITDFDVVAWIKAEMRVMLDEECARAMLIGDGRPSDSDDKIHEIHIRPVVTDAPLFNTVIKVTVPADADEATIAKETIKAVIRGRKNYKGTGKPTFWTTEDVITEMLLLEDGIGHPMYKTEEELSTKLRVADCQSVEVMEGMKITYEGTEYPLIGTIVNFADYNVGADKGGAVSLFDDFDIDYNQQKYLIETRFSGALIKPFSALTLILDKGGSSARTAAYSSSKTSSKE